MTNEMFTLTHPAYNKVILDGVEIDRDSRASYNRDVFIGEKYVVKFDGGSGSGGYPNQGEIELEVWNRFKDTDLSKHLAPVLQAGYLNGKFYVIQERIVENWDKEQFTEIDARLFIREVLINQHSFRDTHSGNWIVRDNIVVMIDLGFGCSGVSSPDSCSSYYDSDYIDSDYS